MQTRCPPSCPPVRDLSVTVCQPAAVSVALQRRPPPPPMIRAPGAQTNWQSGGSICDPVTPALTVPGTPLPRHLAGRRPGRAALPWETAGRPCSAGILPERQSAAAQRAGPAGHYHSLLARPITAWIGRPTVNPRTREEQFES